MERVDATLSFRGSYGLGNVPALARVLQPLWGRGTGPIKIHADFRGLTWLEPAAMTLVVASLADVARSGRMATGSSYQRPRSASVGSYLDRMNVFAIISEGADIVTGRYKDPKGFRPCENFRDLNGQVDVSRELVGAIDEEATNLSDETKHALRICLEELTENVVHHAATPELGGFAAAQVYRRRNTIQLAIADLGQGIRSSLNEWTLWRHARRHRGDTDCTSTKGYCDSREKRRLRAVRCKPPCRGERWSNPDRLRSRLRRVGSGCRRSDDSHKAARDAGCNEPED